MSIKYINPEINQDNLTDYFDIIHISRDNNCGIHSIIYGLNNHTDISTYSECTAKYIGNELYYNKKCLTRFRNELNAIYDEKIKYARDKKLDILTEYISRKELLKRDGEWLIDNDIMFYGDKHNVCIAIFETNPFRFTIMSNLNVGLNDCENIIFLVNENKKKVKVKGDKHEFSGTHYEALSPKAGADIYKLVTMDEIEYINKTYKPVYNNSDGNYSAENFEEVEVDLNAVNESNAKNNAEMSVKKKVELLIPDNITQLFYKKPDIDRLNLFINELKIKYDISLDAKLCFYSSKTYDMSAYILLNERKIEYVEKEPVQKVTKVIQPQVKLTQLTDVDNELLKDFPLYTPSTININMDEFYLNNKIGFDASIHELLKDLYEEDEDDVDGCNKSSNFNMLRHQKIVQTYLNSYTPYRGLLLYHGLGSGKTCSSIAILEGMKHDKKIFIMTPASLQQNYRTQMRFCGDRLFKTNNKWIKLELNETNQDNIFQLFKEYLYLNRDKDILVEYINKYNCIWLIQEGVSNYNEQSTSSKSQINELINILIGMKYKFINYNGVNKKSWEVIRQNKNPFHNSVVVIDEAHNFIGKVNNKINSKKTSVSTDIYENLMDAQNCKIVLLSGTPYINSPTELGVMINLISGYTTQYEFILGKYNKEKVKELFADSDTDLYNIIDYKLESINIIRNPYGFITTSTGQLKYQNSVQYKDDQFVSNVTKIIDASEKVKSVNIHKYKKIPDDEKEFNNMFVKSEGRIKTINNKIFFQTRIAGLISYLGDKTSLMPTLLKPIEEFIPMSAHQQEQYKIYKDREKGTKKEGKSEGSYKVFTRAACNFVFDNNMRPFPDISKMKTEKDFDYISPVERIQQADSVEEDGDRMLENPTYDSNIKQFIEKVKEKKDDIFANELKIYANYKKPQFKEPEYGLNKYSPKFHKILENIISNINTCQLLYSSFRRIEGIEMMSLLLQYQGFQELSFKRTPSGFDIQLTGFYSKDSYKEIRAFSLYTGTEEKEIKEMIRNIYNSDFSKLPNNIIARLMEIYNIKDESELSNIHGELISLLMITSSGAEGIDLQNTRCVHITEPYWHNVRIEQVIGRARRICSHNRLPADEQDVQVYMYMSIIPTDKKDTKQDTADLFLYNIMNEKKILSESFLNTLKESAIDCVSSNKYKCFKFPVDKPNEAAYQLDYKKEPQEKRIKNDKYEKKIFEIINGKMKEFLVDKDVSDPNIVYLRENQKMKKYYILNNIVQY